jgi:hypothetical protein
MSMPEDEGRRLYTFMGYQNKIDNLDNFTYCHFHLNKEPAEFNTGVFLNAAECSSGFCFSPLRYPVDKPLFYLCSTCSIVTFRYR